MTPDIEGQIAEELNKYKEIAKEIDKYYIETYNEMKKIHSRDFSEVAFVKALTDFKTEQVVHLIGNGLSDYDKKILSGVIERHIAGVLYKG